MPENNSFPSLARLKLAETIRWKKNEVTWMRKVQLYQMLVSYRNVQRKDIKISPKIETIGFLHCSGIKGHRPASGGF